MGQAQDPQDAQTEVSPTEGTQTEVAKNEDPNVTVFLQGIRSFDPQSAPRIDLSRVLRSLRRQAGDATREDLLHLTGLDQQVFTATVTAMTSMGLVTVSGDTPVARVAFTPLGEQAADSVR